MEQATAEEISKSLARIAKILAGILLRDIGEGDQQPKIARLAECGFQNTEIAEMLSTTPNTVAVALHSLRAKKKKRKRPARER